MSKDTSPMLFVSHHSSKLGVAEHVEKALNSKGVRCWIAPRDVEPGASFARAIPSAIGESSAVLLLFCSNSAKSRHVERELILADQLGKAIIPLRLERIDPGELSYHLAASQWIDWLEQRDEAIDRIALKARDLQAQAANGNAKTGTISIDELEAKAPPVDITKPAASAGGVAGTASAASGAAATTKPPQPPLSAIGTDKPAAPRPPIREETATTPTADAAAPPRDAHPSEPGKASKLPLFLALGGVGALLLIALAYVIIRSVMTPTAITEAWFVGQWSDSRDCSDPVRFDANGDWIGPDGSRGTWSIEGGRTLVLEGDNIDRQELRMQRVSRNEVRGPEGSSYRCD